MHSDKIIVKKYSSYTTSKISIRAKNLSVLLLVCLSMAGCMEATSLGKEPADHVIITGTPTWSNGIGQLMQLKCAGCHQVPRLVSSPQNVTTDLDLRFEKTFGAIRAAEDIAAQITLGVLQHDIVYGNGSYTNAGLNITIRKMPLQFATPLYADEITALQTWAGNVVIAEQANTSPTLSGESPMTSADGELLYKRHCQSCHGVYGAGGVVKWPLRGYSVNGGPAFAKSILSISPKYPMNTWPVLVQFANYCTLSGAPTTCSGTQLEAIAKFLAQF